MKKSNLITSLDVGSSKVAVVVAELNGEGKLKICGIGSAKSEGVKNGIIRDIQPAVQSIRAAIEEAERTSGRQISDVFTVCEDYRMKFINGRGATPVRGSDIQNEDVDAAIANLREIPLESGETVMKLLMQGFSIDGEDRITNPVGMTGNRLEAFGHLVCGLPTSPKNIMRCIRQSALEVNSWSIAAWADSAAVLTETEKQLGVCLLDIGAGTIDVTVYIEGTPRFTAIIPIGGEAVTEDIAAVFRITVEEAELLKTRYGSADPTAFTANDVIDLSAIRRSGVQQGQTEVVAQKELAEVEEARLREMLTIVRSWLEQADMVSRIPSGVVLTGGVSLTREFPKLAETVLGQRCRLGVPDVDVGQMLGVSGNAPIWSVAIGLLQTEAGNRMRSESRDENRGSAIGKGFWGRIRGWFEKPWLVGNY